MQQLVASRCISPNLAIILFFWMFNLKKVNSFGHKTNNKSKSKKLSSFINWLILLLFSKPNVCHVPQSSFYHCYLNLSQTLSK
jgi:hypothetical protein